MFNRRAWNGRLEKSIYERLFNNDVLGRARKIKWARKFNTVRPMQAATQFDAERRQYGPWRKVMGPFIDALDKYVLFPIVRNKKIERGYSWEDVFVHDEVDLRRSAFHENIFREGTHPYEWLQFRWRRERYFKVERIINGYEVPEWLQTESRDETAVEAMRKHYEWDCYVYNNYVSDMTPTTHNNRAGWLAIDLFLMHGLMNPAHTERHFFNEEDYLFQDQIDIKNTLQRNPFYFDLDTEDGRRQFETKMNKLVEDYPGFFVPEGENYDFDAYYARRAVRYNEDTSAFDPALVEQMRAEIAEQGSNSEALQIAPNSGEASEGRNTIGVNLSERMQASDRRAFQN